MRKVLEKQVSSIHSTLLQANVIHREIGRYVCDEKEVGENGWRMGQKRYINVKLIRTLLCTYFYFVVQIESCLL